MQTSCHFGTYVQKTAVLWKKCNTNQIYTVFLYHQEVSGKGLVKSCGPYIKYMNNHLVLYMLIIRYTLVIGTAILSRKYNINQSIRRFLTTRRSAGRAWSRVALSSRSSWAESARTDCSSRRLVRAPLRPTTTSSARVTGGASL